MGYIFVKAKTKDQERYVGKSCEIVRDTGNHKLILIEGKAIFVTNDQIVSAREYAAQQQTQQQVQETTVIENKEASPQTEGTTATGTQESKRKSK